MKPALSIKLLTLRSPLLFFFILVCSGLSTTLRAETELYPFPKVEDVKTSKGKEKKPAEPFVQALARKSGVEEELLTKTIANGFGRTELIRLILISKKSKKPLEELIKEREKGTRLAKIAESANLNNKEIRKEANALLKELLQEEEKIRNETAKSSGTVAGTSGTLTKNGTSYETLISSGVPKKAKEGGRK